MGTIISDPELRYTPDNQNSLAQLWLEFANTRPDGAPCRVRATGWGNLGAEIHQKYHKGDQVVVSGRLRMTSFDRPEGFKEKRAELTISQIFPLGAGLTPPGNGEPDPMSPGMPPPLNTGAPDNVVPFNGGGEPTPPSSDRNLDDIPF